MRSQSGSRTIRCGFRTGVFALLGLAAVLLTVGTTAQTNPTAALEDAADAYPNFDIRLDKAKASADQRAFLEQYSAAASSASLAAAAAAEEAGLARLKGSGAAVDLNPALGSAELVTAPAAGGFLTAASPDRAATLLAFLEGNAAAYGLAAGQATRELELVADYANPAGNMAWAEFEQKLNGLPVFQGLLRGGFTAKGELVRTTGVLAAGVDAAALSTSPSVGAAQAVAIAAGNVGWKVAESSLVPTASDSANHVTFTGSGMADDAKAWLVYFPLAKGVARLAWATQILGDPYGFLTVVDGETGTILFRKNLTNFQTQSATYNVYNDDSPAPSSPTTALPGANFQAPFIARQSVTLIGNEAPNTFNNLGWMTDNTNGVNGHTDGNNVQAGLDIDGVDGVDAPVAGTNRVLNFAYNPQVDAPTTVASRNGEVTDMFYWTNVYHDRLYRLGFNEVSRNFQNDNFGRGGLALDRVRAEGQDSSGTNNANFQTPVDGTRGRMQMFLFDGPTPDRTSALDHDVLLHELTHGTSNRLHSNAAGLTTTMSGGMGEGWSDFYARALLATSGENVNGVYTTGGWVTHLIGAGYTDNYYYGIRRFPYAVMSNVGTNGRPHNPLTFADIDPAQINLTDGAFPRGPIGSATAFQVHNIGEVWANALNEVRARYITRLGFAVGNERILQYVTDGMKLDPVNPTLLQGRDSIIAAATAAGGTTADIADIWAGFGVRGMGVSAQVINAGIGTVVEAFDTPGITASTATLVSESVPNGRLDPMETVGVSFCISNSSALPSGAVTGTLLASGGVVSPSGAQSFGVVAPAGTACRTFTFVVSAACGANVTATLQADESGAPTRSLAYTLPVGTFASFFGETFDGVVAPALPAGWSTTTLTGTANLWVTSATAPDSTPNRAFAAEPATVSDNVLLSPSIGLPGGVVRLTFRNSFNMETSFDGGVLEISVAGGAFADIITAGGAFVSNGYNGLISSSFGSPIANRSAWTGNSGGYVTTTVTLPAAASGQNIRLRWRMATDSSVTGAGWSVDSISLTGASCTAGPATVQPPTGLYAESIAGNVVTLRWTPPAFGLTPDNYILEGGVNPGDVLASISTGSASPTYTFVAPTGAFHVRMHTASGASRSLASNEIRIFVNVPQPPSAPGNLLGMVNGNAVALAWKNTFAGGAPANLVLDVTGSLATTIPLGLTNRFSFAGVPPGTYTLSLRALNGAGASPSSNPVTLTFPGACSGVPQAPSNLLAHRVGSTIFVSWDPAAAGPAPTAFILNVSGSFVGSFGTTGRALSGVVAPGSYTFNVVGQNPCGNGPASAPVTVTP
jgi:hypothetical protein